jgi:hypothetical protein
MILDMNLMLADAGKSFQIPAWTHVDLEILKA